MAPQEPNLSNLDPFFCKKSMPIWIRKMSSFLGFFSLFWAQKLAFFKGFDQMSELGCKCQNCGAKRNLVHFSNCRVVLDDQSVKI